MTLVFGTPFGTQNEPFITPYGFTSNNSGMVLGAKNGKALYFNCWINRTGVTAGLRPCVKIKEGIHFDSDSLTLK